MPVGFIISYLISSSCCCNKQDDHGLSDAQEVSETSNKVLSKVYCSFRGKIIGF